VAPLCLGGNVFGFTCDEATSQDVLNAYVELGGNFIDTADAYSRFAPGLQGGESETIMGNWLAESGNRHNLVIATKVGARMGADPNEAGASRFHIMAAVEASLRRLRTDYIDLYQIHRDDPTTPLDESLRALDDLVSQGKVRYIGGSNFVAWRVVQALWASDRRGLASFASVQPLYNLMERTTYEGELEAVCQEFGLGVITYYSLAHGFLSGKYRRGDPLPKSWRGDQIQKTYINDRGFRVLEALDSVASATDASVPQVALSWIAGRTGITAPIASATSVTQLRELMGSADVRLTAEDRARLDAASA
jgi:aryl-alcohol dehydrogenase-like predicted oxidoreductase